MFPKAVSLDFWGTIVADAASTERHKTVRSRAYAAVLHSAGLDHLETVPETFFEFLQAHMTLACASAHPPDRAATLLHGFRHYAGTMPLAVVEKLLDLTYELYTEPLLPEPMEGAADFIRWVSGQWPLYLISDTHLLPGVILDRILDRLGLLSYFTARFYSDQTGSRKPDPLPIKLIAARQRIYPWEVIHIGNTFETDGELAVSAGCRSVIVGPPGNAQGQRRRQSNSGISSCNDFSQVVILLRRLNEYGDNHDSTMSHY